MEWKCVSCGKKHEAELNGEGNYYYACTSCGRLHKLELRYWNYDSGSTLGVESVVSLPI